MTFSSETTLVGQRSSHCFASAFPRAGAGVAYTPPVVAACICTDHLVPLPPWRSSLEKGRDTRRRLRRPADGRKSAAPDYHCVFGREFQLDVSTLYRASAPILRSPATGSM